jgi:hypothetical protein
MSARSLLYATILTLCLPSYAAPERSVDASSVPQETIEVSEVQVTSFFQPKTVEDINKMMVLDGELATSLLEEVIN